MTGEAFPPELAARYRLRGRLGQGGFGAVFEVDDLELGRPVALKLLADPLATGEARARFAREARLTARLRHPGIVQVFDHGITAAGLPWICFERIEGRDLAGVLADGEVPGPVRTLAWGCRLAEALALAHAAGVLHRDVKPANVLVRPDDQPVLVDFGLAHASGERTRLTAEGMLLGTPGYLAPEIWMGGEASPAADQYALGAVLFEALTGSPLHPDPSPKAMIDRARSKARAALPAQALEAAPVLGPALLTALEPDPARRFPDLAAMAAALAAGPGGAARRTEVLPSRASRAGVAASRTVSLAVPAASPAPAAPPGARTSRVGPALGAVLAVIALIAAAATRRGPQGQGPGGEAPGGAASPQAAAVAEARARLEPLVEELGRSHRIPGTEVFEDGGGRSGGPDHRVLVLAELTDPRLVLRFKRFADALEDWLRALHALPEVVAGGLLPGPERELLVGRVLPLGRHLLIEIQGAAEDGAFGPMKGGVPPELIRAALPLSDNSLAMANVANRILPEAKSWADAAGDAAMVVHSTFTVDGTQDTSRESLPRAVARLADRSRARERYLLEEAIGRSYWRDAGVPFGPPELQVAAVQAIAASLAEPDGPEAPTARRVIAALRLAGWLSTLRAQVRDSAIAVDQAALIAALMPDLEAGLAHSPGDFAWTLEGELKRSSAEAPPEFTALLRRAREEARVRGPTPPAARPGP